MAYGKIKADAIIYDNSGSDVEKTIASLAAAAPTASPTFTGTVTIPTPAANDNTTKAASTAYVQTELGDYLTTATATSTYAPKASPTFTGTPTVPGYATLASPTFTGTVNAAALTLSGDLTVNGTTTTINSTTLAVDDKNIVLGDVSSPSDSTANGGGITLKGASDIEWKWVSSTGAWTSTEGIHLPDSEMLRFGVDSDLRIYHNGSHSKIEDSGTGKLWLLGSDILFSNAAGNESLAEFTENGSCTLRHDNNIRVTTTAAGVTVNGTVTDSKGDVRSIPINATTSSHTLIASDAGKCVTNTTGGVTVPQSVFSAGDAVTIINHSGSDITITQASGVNLYNTADGSTGNRTLAARGMATVFYQANNIAYISGSGLS